MAGIIFGCIILVLVGWAIVKGKYAPFILIASGVAMLAFSVFFDTGTFMPKKALPTGNDYLNIIEFIRYMFSTRLAGLGLLIMTMVGFASYMTHIGANDAFVNIAIKPLSIIKSPYALVFLAFLLGKAVSMVITSAVGLGVLCLALMGPALAALGMNKKAIGAVLSPPVQLHSFSSAAQLRLRRRLARSRFLITFLYSKFPPRFQPFWLWVLPMFSGRSISTAARAGIPKNIWVSSLSLKARM